jgi:hypothetical protein
MERGEKERERRRYKESEKVRKSEREGWGGERGGDGLV